MLSWNTSASKRADLNLIDLKRGVWETTSFDSFIFDMAQERVATATLHTSSSPKAAAKEVLDSFVSELQSNTLKQLLAVSGKYFLIKFHEFDKKERMHHEKQQSPTYKTGSIKVEGKLTATHAVSKSDEFRALSSQFDAVVANAKMRLQASSLKSARWNVYKRSKKV